MSRSEARQHMTRTAWRLLVVAEAVGLLKKDHVLPLRIVRSRTSKRQQAMGAWSFALMDAADQTVAASWYPAREIIEMHRMGLVEKRKVDGVSMYAVIFPAKY